MDTSFSHETDGRVSLSERDKKLENDYWGSIEFLDHVLTKTVLRVERGEENEHDCFSVEIGVSHVGSETEDRAFHCYLEAFLDRPQLAQLHAYLGFLLAAG